MEKPQEQQLADSTQQPGVGTSPAVQSTSGASVAAPSDGKKHYIKDGFKTRTKGEKLFNQFTYTGLGFFGVTAFSIFVTWLLRDSKFLSPHYNGFVDRTVEAARKSPFFSKFADLINSNMTIATLFLGGTIVSVLPIKWLEDNKARIVKGLDEKLYGKQVADNDPTIQQAHAEMEAMPKQTWLSVIASRGLAFAATYTTSLLLGSAATPVGKATGHNIDSLSIAFGRNADRLLNKNNVEALVQIDKAMMHNVGDVVRSHPNPAHPKFNPNADRISTRIWSYIAQDGFYTLITSQALFVFTRVLAPLFDGETKKRDRQQQLVAPKPATIDNPAPLEHSAPETKQQDGPHVKVSNAASLSRLTDAPQQALATS